MVSTASASTAQPSVEAFGGGAGWENVHSLKLMGCCSLTLTNRRRLLTDPGHFLGPAPKACTASSRCTTSPMLSLPFEPRRASSRSASIHLDSQRATNAQQNHGRQGEFSLPSRESHITRTMQLPLHGRIPFKGGGRYALEPVSLSHESLAWGRMSSPLGNEVFGSRKSVVRQAWIANHQRVCSPGLVFNSALQRCRFLKTACHRIHAGVRSENPRLPHAHRADCLSRQHRIERHWGRGVNRVVEKPVGPLRYTRGCLTYRVVEEYHSARRPQPQRLLYKRGAVHQL